MANTPFLNLVKPTDTDQALITDINNNSDKIDTGVSTLSEQIGQFEGVAIASGTDLNTLTTPGNYYSASSTVTSTLINKPSIAAGFSMSVFKKGSSIQQQINIYSDIYVRGNTSGGFDNWKRLADQATVDGKLDCVTAGTQTSSTSKSYNVPNISRHMVIVHSANDSVRAVILVTASSSGNVVITEIYKAASVSFARGTNTLTVACADGTSTTGVYVYDMVLGGGEMSEITS